MNKLAGIIGMVLLAGSSFCQEPGFIRDSIDQYITRGMQQWSVPGLAIVIVKDGKVVMMKGYGVRDLETREPVDSNTLFMIASNTKLFTATALSQLAYDGKLSLDDKITRFFPDYRVFDPLTTQLVTVRDMLSHHLGTKTFQGDFSFWNTTSSRNQIMYKMRLLKPSRNFRQSFGYCNSCFLTAGQVIPVVSGKPWEVYVYDSILEPLDMTHTHALGNGMDQMEDAASPYSNNFTGKLSLLPFDNVDNLAPAGSIVSCVRDLSHWLLLQLDSGRYAGKQVLPWAVLNTTRQMQTIISSTKSPNLPTHFEGYGLGIFEADYAGKQVFWHTGGADGFVTNVCFVPEENLGISILTNNDNQDFFEALRYQILDAYLGVNYVNRSDQYFQDYQQEFRHNIVNVENMQARVTGKQPPLDLDAYTGTYGNELYGPVTVTRDHQNLIIHFTTSRNLTGRLQYMDSGEWLLTYSNPAYGIFPLQFKVDNGKVLSMQVKVNDFLEYDPYVFTKEIDNN